MPEPKALTQADAAARDAVVGRVIPPRRITSDADALDIITEWLRDPEWGVGMLEDIADQVRRTGRSVENYPDDRPTWGRH